MSESRTQVVENDDRSSSFSRLRQNGTRSILPVEGSTLIISSRIDGYQFDDLYRIEERVGSGSYSEVFKCYHKANPQVPYAVKKLDKKKLEQKESNNSNVYREISILKELTNVPNVVQLIDLFQDKQFIYLVQVLAEGGDVFQRLGQRKVYTEKDARDLAYILLQTVQAMHDIPIIHRDLKPENLLLKSPTDDTSILLADFGFARYISPNEFCQTRCGTPAFVAPEILLGIPYGIKADLWSIGCLLYMLISGYPPFTGHNHRELFCKVRAGDFVFHENVFGKVSIHAKTLIANLLTVNMNNRYSATQAIYNSEWFQMKDSDLLLNDLSSRTLQNFKSFSAKKMWKKAKHAILWATKQKFWNPDNISFNQQMTQWDQQAIQHQMEKKPAQGNHDNSDNQDDCDDYDIDDLVMSFDDDDDNDINDETRVSTTPPTRILTTTGSIRIPNAPMKRLEVPCVRFGDVYKLQREIRRGTSAYVYTCTHVHTKEIYAVKIIDRKQLTPLDDENVLTEVACMQALSGIKYCVQLLDFYEEPEWFYLVMEYMAGGDVFERIVNLKAYTEKDARDLAVDLLRAVKAIHDKGIAHRDIKPQNLLLSSFDNHTGIKVGDFGFSRRVHTPNSLTSRVGTPTYVAPEILKNIPHDERVDMWAVGVVIYVLLVGYPPFLEDDQAILFDKIRMGDWVFVDEDWNHISDEAKALIWGLLRVDPKERWSVDQALRCRWIQQDALSLSSISLDNSVSSIRAKRKGLRAAARSVVWNGNQVNDDIHTQALPMDIVDESESEYPSIDLKLSYLSFMDDE